MSDVGDLSKLISTWDRSDRRRSIFAPGVEIFQALTHAGKTASGLGETRLQATACCLSETAEIIARGAADLSGPAFSNHGFAAHPDRETARHRAHLEAHERRQVWQWWRGQRPAAQIPDHWLAANGITDWLRQQRAGADLKRNTALWVLPPANGATVVISRSVAAHGADPILGFGAAVCMLTAASKALAETFLMELNLIEMIAARGGYVEVETGWIEAKIAQYAKRCPVILPAELADLDPAVPRLSESDQISALALSTTTHLTEIATVASLSRSVWHCRLSDTVQLPSVTSSSPFMSRIG